MQQLTTNQHYLYKKKNHATLGLKIFEDDNQYYFLPVSNQNQTIAFDNSKPIQQLINEPKPWLKPIYIVNDANQNVNINAYIQNNSLVVVDRKDFTDSFKKTNLIVPSIDINKLKEDLKDNINWDLYSIMEYDKQSDWFKHNPNKDINPLKEHLRIQTKLIEKNEEELDIKVEDFFIED